MLHFDNSTITLASCTPSASAIVTDALCRSTKFRGIEVHVVPCMSNPLGFADVPTLVQTAFKATQGLFAIDTRAVLTISVLHETVSYPSPGLPLRHEFSAGFMTLCHPQGPLGWRLSDDWLPEGQSAWFQQQAGQTFKQLQAPAASQPPGGVTELAEMLSSALTQHLSMDVSDRIVRVN